MNTKPRELNGPPFETEFFVSGGTMPESALSYVERAADRQLLDALLDGKFCYVLNSRQMGKSSLCVRVKTLLTHKGVACAFVDLTRIGGQNLSAEQWYAGILGEIGRSLGLRAEVLAYWKGHEQESPMQRVFGALREVVLETIDGLVAIFVDEIDAARSLPFNADEFLTGIRECYNRRAHDPVYNRLTFCLLGAAVPSDLIRDARTTPFNIGERIYLRDFTLQEASALAKGLGAGREHLLNRVYYWSQGHPFLTQSLCTAIEHDPSIQAEKDVDALVSRDLFEPKARETNINLADVGNRVLNGYSDGDDVEKFRADILSAYEKALRGSATLQDDESNRVTAVLKLSGLMRSEGKVLKVRNPIYERVFGKAWIKENMPGQEVRRQRRAFFVGVLRTSVFAGVIVAVIATLALRVDQLYHEAKRERDRANYEVYVSDMNLIPTLWQRGDIEQIRKLLATTSRSDSRGWEWSMWNRLVHLSTMEIPDVYNFALSPDASRLLVRTRGGIKLLDAKTFKLIQVFPGKLNQQSLSFLPDGKRMIENEAGKGVYVFDLATARLIAKIPSTFIVSGNRSVSPDGKWALGATDSDMPVKIDLVHYTTEPIEDQVTGVRWRQLSPSGKRAIWTEEYTNTPGKKLAVSVRETTTWKEIARLHAFGEAGAVALSPDDKHAATGSRTGWLQYWDIATGKELWRIQAHAELLQRLEFSADGKRLVTAGRERFGKVFSISDTGASLMRTFPDAGNVMIAPKGDRVFIGYFTLRAYDLPGQDPVPTIHVPIRTSGGAAVASDGSVVVADANGVAYELNVLNSPTPKLIFSGKVPIAGGSPLRKWLYLVAKEGYDIWDLDTRRIIYHVPIDNLHSFPSAAFPNSNKVVVVGHKLAQIWNLDKGKAEQTVETGGEPINIAEVSPDGRTVALGLNEGEILLLDLPTGVKKLVSDHSASLIDMKFSEDGTRLATASEDDTGSIVDVAAGTVAARLSGHSQSVISAHFSPDGRRVATASDDGTARIWDAQTGRELTTLDLGMEVLTAAFVDGGKSLATISKDGTVKLWTTDNSWKQK